MFSRISQIVSRELLIVMAMTFLSPAVGAQIATDHDQLHARVAVVDASSVAHDHEGESDHDDAHALIGHLFLHMPVHFSIAFQVVLPRFVTEEATSVLQSPPSFGIPELPFKPPRILLFV